MPNYFAQMNRTASTTASIGSLVGDATRPRRMKIYDFWFGSEATPANNAFLLLAQKCTAAGTSTAVTPVSLDNADIATEQDVGENHTVEPTYTSNTVLVAIGCNQQATTRWWAAPGDELVTPQTAANGVGWTTPTASTVAVTLGVYWRE